MIRLSSHPPHARTFCLSAKQGISSRFLSYWNTVDTTVGAKALGPDQTVSGKVASTVSAATQQARAIDEQKGISKTATDVRSLSFADDLSISLFILR